MTLTASVIIVWLLIGLVIGGLARLLVPGRQHIGLIMTILIGIVAALLGGINVMRGKLTHRAVADAHGMTWTAAVP